MTVAQFVRFWGMQNARMRTICNACVIDDQKKKGDGYSGGGDNGMIGRYIYLDSIKWFYPIKFAWIFKWTWQRPQNVHREEHRKQRAT